MIDASRLLANIPAPLRDELVLEYRGIAQAYMEGRWKATGIDGGRFCEVVYSIVSGAIAGTFPASASKPSNFPAACRALETRPAVGLGDHSLRILIPRVLPGVYDIRNNRNVGHVGGDVSSNKMDATFVRDAATWVVAELVRVFHLVSTHEAQESVDALVERRHPLVWQYSGIRRVLDPDMSAPNRALVLLYTVNGACAIGTLQGWVKYKKNFRGNVLGRLAEGLLVEIDDGAKAVIITPLGIEEVEKNLLPK